MPCRTTTFHPPVPILNSHRLDEVENPRLKTGYNFTAEWVKGTLNSASDPKPIDMLAENEVDNTSTVEIRAPIEELETVANQYQKLKHYRIP